MKRKTLLFSAISLIYMMGIGQNVSGTRIESIWEGVPKVDSVVTRLQASKGFDELSTYEQGLLYALNFARMYPKRFKIEVLQPYLDRFPQFKGSYSKSLVVELDQRPRAGYLFPEGRLVALAAGHAVDLARSGSISHTGSNGKTTSDRMASMHIECWGESINLSTFCLPYEVIISQLLDIDVPDLGHRKALLDPDHHWVGVAKRDGRGVQITVFDLGCF